MIGHKFIEGSTGEEWEVKSLIPDNEVFAGQWNCIELSTGDDGIWTTEQIEECHPAAPKKALDMQIGGENNGGTTDYYRLPEGAKELNDIIEALDMSFAEGNIFKATYRLGKKEGVSKIYDLNKIIYFANRLIKIEQNNSGNSA